MQDDGGPEPGNGLTSHDDLRPADIQSGDFSLIEDAVMETPRGRWFLREYGRRMRAADTDKLLQAIKRLEGVFVEHAESSQPVFSEHVPEEAKNSDIAWGREPEIATADAPNVMAVQEKLLDIVWYMRERGFDGRLCTAIGQEARKLTQTIGPIAEPSENNEIESCVSQDDEDLAEVSDHSVPASFASGGPASLNISDSVQTAADETGVYSSDCPADEESRPAMQSDAELAEAEIVEEKIAEVSPGEASRANPDRTKPATQWWMTGCSPTRASAPPSALPSHAAAATQKAAQFAAIDGLDERRKLALFF